MLYFLNGFAVSLPVGTVITKLILTKDEQVLLDLWAAAQADAKACPIAPAR